MDFLLGVPGKLKTLLDRLSSTWAAKLDTLYTDYTAARATKLSSLDAAITSRAAAATWTSALATYLADVARRKPCASIINYYSAGGTSGPLGLGSILEKEANVKSTLCGALTANTLATVINRTGDGCVNFLAANSVDATARTIRMKVTIDGVAVFDATTNSIAAMHSGLVAVGGAEYYAGGPGFEYYFGRLEYDASFKVEIASSLTETDKIKVWTNEELR